MIYLIGGAPRCGKSTLAKIVAKETNSAWISSDALEGVAYQYVPPSQLPKLFPKTAMRLATDGSNDQLYSEFKPTTIANAYLRQGRATWGAIKAMAEAGLKEGRSYVIEGHQVQPALMAQITRQLGPERVQSIIAVRTDFRQTVKSLRRSQDDNDWVIAKTKNPETHERIARMIVAYSKKLWRESERYGIPVHEMDGDFWTNVYRAASKLQAED